MDEYTSLSTTTLQEDFDYQDGKLTTLKNMWWATIGFAALEILVCYIACCCGITAEGWKEIKPVVRNATTSKRTFKSKGANDRWWEDDD